MDGIQGIEPAILKKNRAELLDTKGCMLRRKFYLVGL
jgi:hypothetical protein